VSLRRHLREAAFFRGRAEPNLREYLDLVALGTVADVVPLTGVNRILVKHGLADLARASRPGVAALKAVSGFFPKAPVTARHVGFRLAPRLNAAGRLADARAGVELLTTSDLSRAQILAQSLDAANTERQAIEKRIVEEAIAQAEEHGGEAARAFVLSAEGWHPGVFGVVASRVVDRFHRPTFVVGIDEGKGRGSGRSISGFHLFEALQACAEHLVRFGGHRHAAGITVEPQKLQAFREAFEAVARARIRPEDFVPSFRVDALVEASKLDFKLAEAIEGLAPFGAGNPEQVLASLGVKSRPRLLAAKNGGAAHLKLQLNGAEHLDVIGFGLGERPPEAMAPLDAAFNVAVDEWNGTKRLSLKLKDWRPANL